MRGKPRVWILREDLEEGRAWSTASRIPNIFKEDEKCKCPWICLLEDDLCCFLKGGVGKDVSTAFQECTDG